MITREVIDTLYKQYHTAPHPADTTDLALLLDYTGSHHKLSVDIDADCLTIGSLNQNSPFNRIALHCINAVVPFDNWVALVMHSSILFLSRNTTDVNVHLKPIRVPFYKKLTRFVAMF
jgi:hypothetical protein